ncbi:hypothetical protein ACAW74_15370 [Fibrella sp. WM1]|uniref:hypothetical protein n=1 Tax=Fibrella musci TaxID=3242485 RepID=UPI00351FD047
MSLFNEELNQLLYADQTGEIIGLDEVQLLDPIPEERIPAIIALLSADDLYAAYQAGLILAAWGVEAGVDFLHSLVIQRIDQTITLEPHRLWDEDNVYDVIADALSVAILSGYEVEKILTVIRPILALYGTCYFESKLKHVLVKLNTPALLPNIEEALQLALDNKRYYQASQLLPVIAHYNTASALSKLPTFRNLVSKDKRIKYNIDEMRAYLP